jgi:hypothetical protein
MAYLYNIKHADTPEHLCIMQKQARQFYEKRKKTMKQNATKLPMIIPSLLFFADILPISVLIPGTWLAACVILRLMLAKVSRCR